MYLTRTIRKSETHAGSSLQIGLVRVHISMLKLASKISTTIIVPACFLNLPPVLAQFTTPTFEVGKRIEIEVVILIFQCFRGFILLQV